MVQKLEEQYKTVFDEDMEVVALRNASKSSWSISVNDSYTRQRLIK